MNSMLTLSVEVLFDLLATEKLKGICETSADDVLKGKNIMYLQTKNKTKNNFHHHSPRFY